MHKTGFFTDSTPVRSLGDANELADVQLPDENGTKYVPVDRIDLSCAKLRPDALWTGARCWRVIQIPFFSDEQWAQLANPSSITMVRRHKKKHRLRRRVIQQHRKAGRMNN